MARLHRYAIPGHPQHVILRGNNRQAIFVGTQDYEVFRDSIVEAAQHFGLAVHAHVWMTNHVHLLATPNDPLSLAKTLQLAGRRYVQYFNCRYQRSGTLWEGRYRATLVDSESYLLACMRY
jgi:putative transposase